MGWQAQDLQLASTPVWWAVLCKLGSCHIKQDSDSLKGLQSVKVELDPERASVQALGLWTGLLG